MKTKLKFLAPAACAVSALALVGCGEEPKVEIKPEWPKPMFVGTPVKAELPNLEKPGEAKKSFMAPEGTVKLSAGKSVTGSDSVPIIGELAYVTDGDLDGGEGSYVELGPGLQWVQIDLEKEAMVNSLVVLHFHANARAYKDVIVQISNDAEFKEGVTTVFNSDEDDSAKLGAGKDPTYIETNHGRIMEFEGVTGRYVRLYSGGNSESDSNHYVEVEVYGIPAK